MWFRSLCVAASLLALVSLSAQGNELARAAWLDARELGRGRLTWFGLHVYDVSLWARSGARAPLDDQPFLLELRYARSLSGRAIADASRDEIARLGLGSEAQRTLWHAQMVALFPDVVRDRRLAGFNQPGRGVRFYVDGRPLGELADPEFARAFFAIWFDPRTRSPELRRSLLAGLDS